jgi:hypothetical protein
VITGTDSRSHNYWLLDAENFTNMVGISASPGKRCTFNYLRMRILSREEIRNISSNQ